MTKNRKYWGHSQKMAYKAGYSSGFYNVRRSPSTAQRHEWHYVWREFMCGWNESQLSNSLPPLRRFEGQDGSVVTL